MTRSGSASGQGEKAREGGPFFGKTRRCGEQGDGDKWKSSWLEGDGPYGRVKARRRTPRRRRSGGGCPCDGHNGAVSLRQSGAR